jgi:hypothetical protein
MPAEGHFRISRRCADRRGPRPSAPIVGTVTEYRRRKGTEMAEQSIVTPPTSVEPTDEQYTLVGGPLTRISGASGVAGPSRQRAGGRPRHGR